MANSPHESTEESTSINQNTVGNPFKIPVTTNQATGIKAPRYLIVKREEGDFSRVSPFLISKLLYGIAGQTKDIKKIRDGLLIETSSARQSEKLLTVKKLGDMQVTVTPHGSLNASKGVIFCRDLLNCSVTEIMEGLRNEGVVDVKRITSKRDGRIIESAAHILTFDTPKLPSSVKVAFDSLKVRQYIPPPLRCFKCQKFGHSSTKCTSATDVCICGKPIHEGTECNAESICIDCDGSHFANSKECQKYKEEAAIQTVKVTEKVSYAEARRKVLSSLPTTPSYSQVLTKPPIKHQEIVECLLPRIRDMMVELLGTKANMDTPGTSQSNIVEVKRKRNLRSTNDETDTDDNQPVSYSDSYKREEKGATPKKPSKRGRPKNRQPP